MLFRLILLFTIVPLIELFFLMQLSEWMGIVPTIGLVLVTGVVGASLARQQGLKCWIDFRRRMSQGQLPTDLLLEGPMILAAALLLITPGVLTDAVGFALLIPPIRGAFRRELARRFDQATIHQTRGFRPSEPFSQEREEEGPRQARTSKTEIIDVKVITPEEDKKSTDKKKESDKNQD